MLGDREAAANLKAHILCGVDRLEALQGQQQGERAAASKLQAEKAQIEADRATLEQSNRIAEMINATKAEATAIIDRMEASLPRLRNLYRQLMEKSLDPSLPEAEQARLSRAADLVEGNFRERIHYQLNGSERSRSWNFLRIWIAEIPKI